MGKKIQIYLIPGAVFLSVLIGGGYGTGREIVHFFTQYGPFGGLLAIATAGLVFAVVLGVTFEFARTFRVYDYRSFFEQLIGPFWILFEVLYVLLFLLVLGVVSAAAGDTLEQRFGVASWIGLTSMPVLVAFFVLFGRMVVEKALALWSVVMYGVFITYFICVIQSTDNNLISSVSAGEVESGWLVGGGLYAMYNLAVAPGLLFATRAIETRRQAFLSAVFTSIAILIPAVLFHFSYTVGYPQVLEQALPNYWMINHFAPDWLLIVFVVALFGTLIETGVGLVQSLLERLPKGASEKGEGKMWLRATVALSTVSLAALLGTVGIIELIVKGYTFMSYGFALVYVIPVCTLGVYKFTRQEALPMCAERV